MEDEQQYSARLDYDLIVVTFGDGGVSIAPGEIATIRWCSATRGEWVVRMLNNRGTSIASWRFDDRQKSTEWHAHVHNLWRDARIVAARAR